MENHNDENHDDNGQTVGRTLMQETAPAAVHPTLFPPNLPARLRKELQSKNSQNAILHLAKFFRDQSKLMLDQANRLEQMALDREMTSSSSSSLLKEPSLHARLQQTSLLTLVTKTTTLMEEMHEQLDDMESRLPPWENGVSKGRRCTAYSVFVKDQFAACAERVGSSQTGVVSKEMSRVWKTMSAGDKAEYQRLAAEEAQARKKHFIEIHTYKPSKRQRATPPPSK